MTDKIFVVTDDDGVQGVYIDPALVIRHARAAWPDCHMMLFGAPGGGALAPEGEDSLIEALQAGGVLCVQRHDHGSVAWLESHRVRTTIPSFSRGDRE